MAALPFNPNDYIDAASLGLSDDERKRLILSNLLLGLGGGLMNARGNNMLGAAGSGAVQGAMLAQNAVQSAQQDKINALKMRMGVQEYNDKISARKQAASDQQTLGEMFAGSGPDLSRMGPGGPTPENAAAVTAGSPKGDSYRKAAAFYAQRGDTEGAKRMMDIANSFDEEYSQTPQVMMVNGKPVNALIGKKGGVKTLDGYGVKPDFAEVDLGGTKQFVNKYNLPESGASFDKTMTPGETDSSKRGWATFGLEKDKFAYQKTKDAQEGAQNYGTPVQVTDDAGNTSMYVPVKGTSQAVPLTDASGKPLNKTAATPQAYRDKSYNLSNLRDSFQEYQSALNNFSAGSYLSPSKVSEIGAKYNSLKMGLKNLYELGALAGPDVAILEQQITDPTSMRGVAMSQSALNEQMKVVDTMLTKAKKNLDAAYNQKSPQGRTSAANMSDEQLRKALGF